jgi:hypothetical protein
MSVLENKIAFTDNESILLEIVSEGLQQERNSDAFLSSSTIGEILGLI